MEHQRRGDLYFKSGKDGYMSSNLKALHTYFLFVTGKSSKKSSKIGEKKESLSHNKESWF
jgi:hypothetical protein